MRDEDTYVQYEDESGFYFNLDEIDPSVLDSAYLTQMEESEKEEPKYKFKTWSDDELLNFPPLEFLIDGILYKKDVGMLVAPSATGKTFVALNLAYACATQGKFAGRFQVNEQMNVLYSCGEGLGGIRNRIEAAKEQAGHCNTQHGQVKIVGSVPNLCNKADVTKFIDELQQQHFAPSMIIIDTLHTAISGHDDSSNKDMGIMSEHCKLIRDTFKSVILLVHHTGKNGEYRGASSLFGDADFFIKIDGTDSTPVKKLVFDKIKDGEKPGDVKFELVAKRNSMMVNWLPQDAVTYTSAQLWYFDNIVVVLKCNQQEWLSAADVAKDTERSKKANSDDSHRKAVERYLKDLHKDGYVNQDTRKSPKNGKETNVYQFLKDAPKQTVIGEDFES